MNARMIRTNDLTYAVPRIATGLLRTLQSLLCGLGRSRRQQPDHKDEQKRRGRVHNVQRTIDGTSGYW